MKTVTNRSHASRTKVKVGSKEHIVKSYSWGHHPWLGPLKDTMFKTKTEMKKAMAAHPAYNDSLKTESISEEYRIKPTNDDPNATRTRFAVTKHSKTGKQIGQAVIFTDRGGAERHVARQTKDVKESVLSFGDFLNEITIRDAAGKKHSLGNVKFRGADGKIHSAPPGKSGSSGGGDE